MSLFFSTLKRSEVATEDFLTALDSLRETHSQIVDLAQETMQGLDTLNKLVEVQEVVASESFNDEAIVKIINHGRALESLCGKALTEINRASALKALEDASQEQTNTIIDKIKAFFQRIMEWLKNLFSRIDPALQKIKAATSFNADSDVKHSLIKREAIASYVEAMADLKDTLEIVVNKVTETSKVEDYEVIDKELREKAAKYPALFKFSEEKEGLVFEASCVIFGTLKEAGYTTLDEAKSLVELYDKIKDSWWLEGSKLELKLTSWMVGMGQKSFAANAKVATDPEAKSAFEAGAQEMQFMRHAYKSALTFLNVQNKMKSILATTILGVARECSTAPAQQPTA